MKTNEFLDKTSFPKKFLIMVKPYMASSTYNRNYRVLCRSVRYYSGSVCNRGFALRRVGDIKNGECKPVVVDSDKMAGDFVSRAGISNMSWKLEKVD